MEIIRKKINKAILKSNKISKNTCFFDIETTGLNRKRDTIYLIGILYYDETEVSWVISQYFANNLKDEPQLLLEASKFLISFKTIVNYNGNSFDIPFVNKKLEYYGLPAYIDIDKSLDIYSILRKNKDLLVIENLKLKTVERYLNIYRDDVYTGKDCIDFYKNYILTSDPESKQKLLSHNFDDLYYLIDIMEILDVIKEKKSFTIKKDDENIIFSIENILESKDTLTLEGNIEGINENIIHYDSGFDLIIEEKDKFKINLYTSKGLISHHEVCTYIDINDYIITGSFQTKNKYKIPNNIIPLKVDKKYLLEEILSLLRAIVIEII